MSTLLGSEWKVRTPWGVFVLVSVQPGQRAVAPKRRVLSPQEAARVWFFVESSLERPGGFELEAARELLHATTGDWIHFRGTTRDLPRLEHLRAELHDAIRAGRLRFEEVPQHAEPDGRRRPVMLPEPPPSKAPTQRREPPSFEYSVRLVDEVDQGIPGIEVTFSWSSRVESRTTGCTGVARCEVPESSAAKVEIVGGDALAEALRSRWSPPRLVPRPSWLKDGPKTTVVPFRSDRPLPAVEVKPEVPFTVSLQPFVALACLRGLYFDTNRCFLLPTSIPYVRGLVELYAQYPHSTVLVVGHTDTTSEPSVNDPLSVERADAMAAYLRDDVAAWLEWYGADKPSSKRWGAREDRLMLRGLPDYGDKPAGEDPIRWFRRTRGVSANEARRAIIAEYMDRDGTRLPASSELVTHGCGESFPLPDAPPAQQTASARHSDQEHRRVELFFFDRALGVQPAPPSRTSGTTSPEYPEWLRRVGKRHELRAEGVPREVTVLEMHDALFRTNSCVVLPEGEDPTRNREGHLSLTSVGLVATVLQYCHDNPEKKLFVAGHCDTTGSVDFNQKLSDERALAALALLTGDRDAFRNLCHKRHQVSDYKQILSWLSQALDPELLAEPFDCAPAAIDDKESTGVEPVRHFQGSYNRNKAALGASTADLREDGSMGPLTWGAFFDCYEFALREELGRDADGVAELRSQLRWVDENRKALGFSEHHPVDNLGRDGYRSQANRRVEVLFFDEGEEPDLTAAEANPEGAALYLPGRYRRGHVGYEPRQWGGAFTLRLYLHDERQLLLPQTDYELTIGEVTRRGTTDDEGRLVEEGLPRASRCHLRWLKECPFNPPTADPVEIKRREDEPSYLFARELQLLPSSRTRLGTTDMMLRNLGYSAEALPANWAAFQAEYGLDPAPYYHGPTYRELQRVHGRGLEPESPPIAGTPDGEGDAPEGYEDDGLYATQISIKLEELHHGPVADEPWELRDATGAVLASGTLDAMGRSTAFGVDSTHAFLVFPQRDESSWPEENV